MSRRQKILITGGAGQIGEFIIKDLHQKTDAYDVAVFDVREPKDKEVRFFRGDIRNLESLRKATEGFDVIFHLAAINKERLIPNYPEGWDINATSTFNVFESAVINKIKKVVFASSICATGLITWTSPDHSIDYFPVDELHPCKPQDLYGVSKLINENLAWMYSTRSNTAFMGLRIATVWFKSEEGIDESTQLIIDNFIKDPTAFLSIERPPDKRRSVYVIKDTKAAIKDLTWQYVDARDVAQAFRLALEKNDIRYRIYNIGADDTPSEWDSMKLAQYFYPDVPIHNPVVFLVDKKRALWDISRARKELGYRPLHNWKEYLD